MSKINVAILGGGVGALTAAFHLTQPALAGRYQVTVYQQGFRLGGKGATGRGPHGRIEEHGLHMLMGFYRRAFRMLRTTYDEWQLGGHCPAGHPFRTFEQAFEPMNDLTVMERVGSDWVPWRLHLPSNPAKPGLETETELNTRERPIDFVRPLVELAWRSAKAALPSAGLGAPTLGSLAAGARRLARSPIASVVQPLVAQLNALIAVIGKLLRGSYVFGHSVRRGLWGAEFLAVLAKGILLDARDGDFDALDDFEVREWLQKHGLSKQLSEWVPIQLLCDLGFAYRGGDNSSMQNASAAAGVTLRVLLRCILRYRQAPLFRMKAGMADTLFTPLYQVLQDRGVAFQFFHRVKRLDLAGSNVERISIENQVARAALRTPYDPLMMRADGVQSWQSEPDWAQLAGAKVEHQFESPLPSPYGQDLVLTRGSDFDHVVLGISLGGLPGISPDLEQRADWQNMLHGVPTVKTQSAQLWLRTPPLANQLHCTYAPPFSTMSDMSDLLPREDWGADGPKSLQYLVGTLPEAGPHGMSDAERMRRNMARFLREEAPGISPELTPAALYHPDPQASEQERLDFQFVKENHNPSDRYVQSFPGTISKRLPSKLPGVDNLALAGDWVRTGLSVGCVESAVQGGMQAANVVQGLPQILVD